MSAERIKMYAERMKKERDEAQLASLETNERDTKIILELRAENERLLEKIKRQEAGLERVRAWMEGGYRDESCEVLESVLEALK